MEYRSIIHRYGRYLYKKELLKHKNNRSGDKNLVTVSYFSLGWSYYLMQGSFFTENIGYISPCSKIIWTSSMVSASLSAITWSMSEQKKAKSWSTAN